MDELATPRIGERYRLVRDVDRYPFFMARAGAAGTITRHDQDGIALRLDAPLVGAEEWDNEVHWDTNAENLGDFTDDCIKL